MYKNLTIDDGTRINHFPTVDELTLRVSTCTYKPNARLGEETFTLSNTRDIMGWTGVSVTRGIEAFPSSFSVEFTEPFGARNEVIVQPGDHCEVLIGRDVVLTGFVDRYLPSYDTSQHTTRITGRSKCQDLVDCSTWPPGRQIPGKHLLDVVHDLCDPYGIKVALAPGADQGEIFGLLMPNTGEPPYTMIEELCRIRGLLFYDLPDGSLLISDVGTTRAASGFKEGINVLSATGAYGSDLMYRTYEGFRNGQDILRDTGGEGFLVAKVQDETVQRFRYRGIVNEIVTGGVYLVEKLVKWELARRFGRSYSVSLVTDSWRDSSGALYAPNTLVPLDLPNLKLFPETWLISNVVYKRDLNGTTCELVVMPPEGFKPRPTPYIPLAADIAAK